MSFLITIGSDANLTCSGIKVGVFFLSEMTIESAFDGAEVFSFV